MHIAIGILIVFAFAVTATASVAAFHGFWRAGREFRSYWRTLPQQQRRRTMAWTLIVETVAMGLAVLVISAPWGTRHTLVYVIVAIAVISVPPWLVGTARLVIAERRRAKTRK